VPALQGRAAELATLTHWVEAERGPVVQALGAGGIGKTALAAWLAQGLAPAFAVVYWRKWRRACSACLPPGGGGCRYLVLDQQGSDQRTERCQTGAREHGRAKSGQKCRGDGVLQRHTLDRGQPCRYQCRGQPATLSVQSVTYGR
jgi:hypothetical protein